MRKMLYKGLKGLFFAVFFTFSVVTVCFAQEPFAKLGRGAANTLTGWMELPKDIYSTSKESNAFSGLTLGLARGAGMALVRTGAGIYEMATFPFPVPENYKPVLEPEYVF